MSMTDMRSDGYEFTSTNWRQSLFVAAPRAWNSADEAETVAIDRLVSSWSENISVSFFLRSPGYGLTLWCALGLLGAQYKCLSYSLNIGFIYCESGMLMSRDQLGLESRDHFFGLGLRLTVIGLGLGLGLMKYWSRSHYALVSWSQFLKSISCSSNVMTSDCVPCSIRPNTRICMVTMNILLVGIIVIIDYSWFIISNI